MEAEDGTCQDWEPEIIPGDDEHFDRETYHYDNPDGCVQADDIEPSLRRGLK